MMNEKPILFSGEMVKAILEGRKTQTRRVVNPQLPNKPTEDGHKKWGLLDDGFYYWGVRCPYGKVGDRLWVRETWDFRYWVDQGNPWRVMVSYGADGFQKFCQSPASWNPTIYGKERWRPSIHMPRWASRITLEIVRVDVERLRAITRDDAKAEGVSGVWVNPPADEKHYQRVMLNPYVANYSVLWDEINGERGFGWDVNPWVWVLEFKVV